MITELKVGDYIEKSELDTEQKYNDVVEVFERWGFTKHRYHSGFDGLSSNHPLSICDGTYANSRSGLTRCLTYDQIMQLKKVDVDNCNIDKLVSNRVSTVNRDLEGQMAGKINSTINERGNNYGKFKDGADIMQELKSVMRSTPNWHKLTPSQREALEMIQHKIGRILNGNPSYTDSWHDIQGYAKLIEDELNGEVK